MDFAQYPNINAKMVSFGGVKRGAFNKKLFDEAEMSWQRFTPEDMAVMDHEFATTALQLNGSRTSIVSSVITSKAICVYSARTFTAVPVYDVLWLYTNVVTSRMNFIPYNKEHSLVMVVRSGQRYTIAGASTGGFSKKTPLQEPMEQIRNFLQPYRSGIVYGYSDEIENLFTNDFGRAVAMVDAQSMQQP